MFDDYYLRTCHSPFGDLILIDPRHWHDERTRSPLYRCYELLRVSQANAALRMALHGQGDRLRHVFRHVYNTGAYESTGAMLDDLERGLGYAVRGQPDPPRLARVYVARRKPLELPPPRPVPVFDPVPMVPLTSARGFLALETVDGDGAPLGHIACEVVFADGEVRTVVTDERGCARLDPVVQGRCVIRVTSVDGSLWRPDDDGPAESSRGNDRPRRHVVQRGECLAHVAHKYGVGDWKRVWNAPMNEALRSKRKSPHVLCPGDELTIPPRELREIARETDATYRLIVEVPQVEFRVHLRDQHQRPFKNQAYELRVSDNPDETPRTGSTDGVGKLVECVPANARRIHVTLPARGLRWVFDTSGLTPAKKDGQEAQGEPGSAESEAIRAVQARLNALGFPCGKTDGRLGPRTREALALFQRTVLRRDPMPDLDAATIDQLEQQFGVLT